MTLVLVYITRPLFVDRRYLAISGLSGDEGAIMTRNREDVDVSHGLDWGVWRVNVSAGAWYRLVTNYDPWLPDPASDPVSCNSWCDVVPWLCTCIRVFLLEPRHSKRVKTVSCA